MRTNARCSRRSSIIRPVADSPIEQRGEGSLARWATDRPMRSLPPSFPGLSLSGLCHLSGPFAPDDNDGGDGVAGERPGEQRVFFQVFGLYLQWITAKQSPERGVP